MTGFYYLSPTGRKGLDNYKYVSGTSTVLDRALNHFWTWAIRLVPLWIAPNMITLIGLAVNTFGCGLMLSYSPKLDTPVPGWVNVVCGVTLFLYQTLDAIDGKQARRTRSSSALGQLFDHGCDALSTFIGALSLCVCLQTGPQQGLTFVTFTCVGFFVAQWNEYYTHVLSTNVAGLFGVTEAQLMVMAIHIATAFLDRSFWTAPTTSFWKTQSLCEPYTDPVLGFTFEFSFTDCFFYFTVFMALAKWGSATVEAVLLAGPKALKTQIPIFLVLALYAVLHLNDSIVADFTPLPQIVLGVALSLLSSRIIVEGLCKMPFDPWHPTALGCFAMAVFLKFTADAGGDARTYNLAWVVFTVMVAFQYYHYVFNVIAEISSHLRIKCLSIDISWMQKEGKQ